MRVLTSFDLWLKPRLTRGILVVLAEKGALGTPVPEQVVPCRFGCSRGPIGRKITFLDFSRVWHANQGQKIYDINNCVCVCIIPFQHSNHCTKTITINKYKKHKIRLLYL